MQGPEETNFHFRLDIHDLTYITLPDINPLPPNNVPPNSVPPDNI